MLESNCLCVRTQAKIDLKFFKKEFVIFDWSDTFSPEWAPKYYYKLNTGVEKPYQNDTTIRNGGAFEDTAELLDACLDPGTNAGASTYDRDEVPSVDDGPPTNASDMAESKWRRVPHCAHHSGYRNRPRAHCTSARNNRSG